ncbi:uncharacterized protein LOC121377582 [Gigantopelta aegis]|uniref:uncharacterized protein LOC121377582 n=1 Tax=Gigantopelta aegis TaxID=1735272 RepID=UPI001B88B7D3|nr:uncharacterized protein LOC121377582 [Gigantopelta aegis]
MRAHTAGINNMETQKTHLIQAYFMFGMAYAEILHFLSAKHGIRMSMGHLKRCLNGMGLYRRKHYSDIAGVADFLKNELRTSSQLHGYRWMHPKCVQSGFVIKKELVGILLQILDPHGVSLRKKRKLKRREYISRGPNFVWHLDSYDKLKPYGICINGCIDGFSRHIIWMEVNKTSNDPNVIGGYFAQAVLDTGGIPTLLRGDMGTENSLVADMQSVFAGGDGRFVYGTSQHNQCIEAWWCILRRKNAQFWMSVFEDIKTDGLFSGDHLNKSLIQFCFLPLIKEITDLVNEWNTHRIRINAGSRGYGGRPVTLYNLPELYGTLDFKYLVETEELDISSIRAYPPP